MPTDPIQLIHSAAARFLERAPGARWAVYRAPGASPMLGEPNYSAGTLVRVLVAPGPILGRGRRSERARPGLVRSTSELVVASTGAHGLSEAPRRGGVFTIAEVVDEVVTETDNRWRVVTDNPEDMDGLWRMEVDR